MKLCAPWPLLSIITLLTLTGGNNTARAMDIQFSGVLQKPACVLSVGSEAQTVEFGDISKAKLLEELASDPFPFEIKLEKCDTSFGKTFSFSFEGDYDQVDALKVQGNPALFIRVSYADDNETVHFDGRQGKDRPLAAGTNIIPFIATVYFTIFDDVTTGDFTAETNFKIDYK